MDSKGLGEPFISEQINDDKKEAIEDLGEQGSQYRAQQVERPLRLERDVWEMGRSQGRLEKSLQ